MVGACPDCHGFFYRIEENVGPGYITLNGLFTGREQAVKRALLLFKAKELPDNVRITKWRTGKYNGPIRCYDPNEERI